MARRYWFDEHDDQPPRRDERRVLWDQSWDDDSDWDDDDDTDDDDAWDDSDSDDVEDWDEMDTAAGDR